MRVGGHFTRGARKAKESRFRARRVGVASDRERQRRGPCFVHTRVKKLIEQTELRPEGTFITYPKGLMIMASFPRASMAAFSTSVLLAAAACGEVVVSTPSDPLSPGAGGSTGAVVASAAVTSTSSASSGDGGAGGGSSACVPDPKATGDFHEPTCADLAVLAVSHPVLDDADGDGQLEVGETGSLKMNLDEIAGVGFNYYPGVIFETAAAGVTVSSNGWFYAIFACQSNPMIASIAVGGDVAPGTVVTITARVAMLNHDCPDAYAVEVPITVH
jgi:hypothetical protein